MHPLPFYKPPQILWLIFLLKRVKKKDQVVFGLIDSGEMTELGFAIPFRVRMEFNSDGFHVWWIVVGCVWFMDSGGRRRNLNSRFHSTTAWEFTISLCFSSFDKLHSFQKRYAYQALCLFTKIPFFTKIYGTTFFFLERSRKKFR